MEMIGWQDIFFIWTLIYAGLVQITSGDQSLFPPFDPTSERVRNLGSRGRAQGGS